MIVPARTAAIAAALAALAFTSSAAVADKGGPYSPAVRRACKGDYNRFCPNYSLYSSELRRCMQAAGTKVSRRCVQALVRAGEAPRSYLNYYK